MQGFSQQKPPSVKRLGDLLLESGYVAAPDLDRAVDIARKNFQSLGKVLVSSRLCSEPVVSSALEMQKLCKLENMTGSIAVRVLTLMRKELLTRAEALRKVGWTQESYQMYRDPDEITAAKLDLTSLARVGGIPYGRALEKIGDLYLKHKLTARAEVKFEEALVAFDTVMPAAALQVSHVLSKLGRLAVEQRRHDEARKFIDRAQATLEGAGHRQSKEYVKVLHASAEYHVSRRKFTDAEQHYIEAFNMLEPVYGLEDAHVLESVWHYVDVINKNEREQPEKVTLGELFKGSGALVEEQLTQALEHGKYHKMALGRALVTLGLIDEKQLQLALQAQMLVRNGEITAQLGIWIMRYTFKLNLDLEKALEMLHCQPKSRGLLSGELRSASNEMATMEGRLPSNHPDLAFAHAKVGNIYFQRQQFLEADHHFKRALTIFSSNPNAYTEKALDVVDQYGDLKSALDDFDGAVRIAKIAVQMRSKHYGELSIPYAKGLEKLAGIYANKGEHMVAVRCFDLALAVREKLYGTADRELISTLEAKGEALALAMDFAEAEVAYDRALSIAEEFYGHAHDICERITKKLAQVCRDAGNVGKARDLLPKTASDHLFM